MTKEHSFGNGSKIYLNVRESNVYTTLSYTCLKYSTTLKDS